MLKFIRGRGPHLSAERQKQIKELFAFNKGVLHGFPHRPSALAYDDKLSFLAIATKTGSIRLFGKAGVEFHVDLEAEVEIKQIKFVANRGQLLVLCEDSSIQLWEVNPSIVAPEGESVTRSYKLEHVKTCDHFAEEQREGTSKQLTVVAVHSSGSTVLVGTQGGNIYVLDTDSLELSDQVIYQDVLLQNVAEEYKKSNPGEVEVIAEQPGQADKFLIGFSRGLMVLWDNKNLVAENFYVSNQQLESVSWLPAGDKFVSAHNDGSYITWRISDNLHPSEVAAIPYGPFPCKAITKAVSKKLADGSDLFVFSGGMPRASFGDKNTVSLIQTAAGDEEKHHSLDFTSKIIDFLLIDGDDTIPKALVVLAEEELVVVDLAHPDWLQFKLPYLSSVHSSAITFTQHYISVSEEVFSDLVEAGRKQDEAKYTTAAWPVTGGSVGHVGYTKTRDLLITGHEDGSIRFWDASDVNLFHLYTVNTSKLFIATDDDIPNIDGDDVPLGDEVESEWPPFRKVGTFDPYSDDPRLAIRRVILCPISGLLVAAGTAGQVLVFKTIKEAVEKQLNVELISVVEDKDAFVWKGHDQLHVRQGALKFEHGYQPESILQISPPAAITAVAVHSEWGLVAAGTAHGFGVFDCIQKKVVFSKSTLNPADLTTTAGGDALISRRKSFKKSLRESFRRIRKGRSTRSKSKSSGSTTPASSPAKIPEGNESASGSKVTSPVRSLHAADDMDARPVERQIEARTDDGLGSVIRTLYIGPALLTSQGSPSPTLWIGTNAGAIYVYALSVPEEEKRSTESLTCQLGKEIQLKHRAPVIFIQIVDSTGYPVPGPFELKRGLAKAPSTVGTFRALIASEEQFKLFTLPSLKPYCKSKLTAQEGSRARKVAIGQFSSKSDNGGDQSTTEHCMMCMSNQGEVTVYSTTDLKRLTLNQVVKREDVHGMSSLVFTKLGEGLYLHSPSEFERFSLSNGHFMSPVSVLDVPEGARPVKEVRPPIAAASLNEIKDVAQGEKQPEDAPATGGSAPAIPKKTDAARSDLTLESVVKHIIPEAASKPSDLIDEVLQAADELAAAQHGETIEAEDPAIVSATLPTSFSIPVAMLETIVTETVTESVQVTQETIVETVEVIKTVTENVTNGVMNGLSLNGNIENGQEEEDEENGQNGQQESPSLLTNDSMAMDITIDSVKDHMTNMSLNENDTKTVTPAVKVKTITPPPPLEATPIINSNEGMSSPIETSSPSAATTATNVPSINKPAAANSSRGGSAKRGRNRRKK
ncbi:Lethal(2) giant larvae -like protein 1 [Halotydeus destructor]|nr:Lethal(2) giant larvae -like protein 1 [Halotydeus destructor]